MLGHASGHQNRSVLKWVIKYRKYFPAVSYKTQIINQWLKQTKFIAKDGNHIYYVSLLLMEN